MSGPQPATLDHAGIAARLPHQGRMCLLDRLLSWSAGAIVCRADNHRALDHPLRTAAGLLAPCAIEYAAQAMALHGALRAGPGGAAAPGVLASVRAVRFAVLRLDDIAGALVVSAEHLAGTAGPQLYRFVLADEAGRTLVEGRATVVLGAPAAAQNPPP